MKKNIYFAIIILIIFNLSIATIAYARGFADYDDATADAEAKKQIEQQTKEHEQNIGKSSNNYLSELSVNEYTLEPSFDKQIANYEIRQEITSNSIEIITKSDDEKAKVLGDGVVNLQSGENNIDIEVIAENGTVRTYHIKVNKKVSQNPLRVNNLKLFAVNNNGEKEEVKITPEFSENIFKYTCEVYNDVNQIKIENLTIPDDSVVQIEGNENLKVGKNIITISLRSNDNTNETIYKIEAIRKSIESIETKEKKYNLKILLISGIIILLILAIIITKKKGKKSKH